MKNAGRNVLFILMAWVTTGCVTSNPPTTTRFAISEPPSSVEPRVGELKASTELRNELRTVGPLNAYDYDSFSVLKYSNTTLLGYLAHLNAAYSPAQPTEAIYRNYVLSVDLLRETASFSLERDILQRSGNTWNVGQDGLYVCSQNAIPISAESVSVMNGLLAQLTLCEGRKTGGGFTINPSLGATDIETGEPHMLSLMNRGTQVLVHDIEGNYYAGYKHTFVCDVDAKRALAQKLSEVFTPLVSATCHIPDLALQFVTDSSIQ